MTTQLDHVKEGGGKKHLKKMVSLVALIKKCWIVQYGLPLYVSWRDLYSKNILSTCKWNHVVSKEILEINWKHKTELRHNGIAKAFTLTSFFFLYCLHQDSRAMMVSYYSCSKPLLRIDRSGCQTALSFVDPNYVRNKHMHTAPGQELHW